MIAAEGEDQRFEAPSYCLPAGFAVGLAPVRPMDSLLLSCSASPDFQHTEPHDLVTAGMPDEGEMQKETTSMNRR